MINCPKFLKLIFVMLLCSLGAQPTAAVAAEFSKQVFDCVMDPFDTVRIGTPVSGLLEVVNVNRGDRVKRGQILARMNTKVEAATVALLATRAASDTVIAAQTARYNLFSKRYKRTKELLARKVIPRERLDEVETDLTESQADLRRAQLDRAVAKMELARAKAVLDLRIIRSPVDGIVIERRLTGGEYASQDGYVVSLVQLNPCGWKHFYQCSISKISRSEQRQRCSRPRLWRGNFERPSLWWIRCLMLPAGPLAYG